MESRPTLAVWKFSSCDGCQLSLLDVEDELLAIADRVQIAHFLEASSATVAGPYDVSLVEGSITTPEEAERIKEVRATSRTLVTIGACATAGGIQALRNYADIEDYVATVYASPEYISTLATSTPISDHVDVDFELRGCPINKNQLLELVTAMLQRRRPNIATHSRLRGMQEPRHPVRDGLPRHPVSRPDHPGGLRRALPGLQPGLLRLLRPGRDAEPRLTRSVVAEPRSRRAGAAAGTGDV